MKKASDGRRVSRVEKEIQMTIAQFLIRGFKFPLPGLVTVSQVRMPGDLRTAKVYVSVIGQGSGQEIDQKSGQKNSRKNNQEAQLEEVVELLQERAFEIQNFIGKELKLRSCPKLTFFPDTSTENILKIEKIIHDLGPAQKEKIAKDDE